MRTTYEPAAGVNDILVTPDLYARKFRQTDAVAEADEYYRIAETLAESPKAALQELVDAGVELCDAGSCGLSILDQAADQPIFRWTHMAGVYAGHVGGTTPRDFSPCGTTLERRSPQLFRYPGRLFTYFQAVEPPIVEGLVLPLVFEHQPLGTIWIVSHDEERKFDKEDVRVMTALGYFTVAALRATDDTSLPFRAVA